ncbi:hypothetical protein [Rhodococcoides yunnanense]|uniref:hypothetical protein n=1 Tax=Rhodococcoides yunnanense TaxID=278209 RepID=UPI00093546CE|nr:hypothetical protein [Rhodococcus yunnanensis]
MVAGARGARVVATIVLASGAALPLVACDALSQGRGDAPPCIDAGGVALEVARDDAPSWARIWQPNEDGASGSGRVSTVEAADDNSMFRLVYSCVGLIEPDWSEVSAQGEVRIGVDDYKYRVGNLMVENTLYHVDVVLAPIDSTRADFGVAYAPARTQARAVEVSAGPQVVQKMRESGVL